MSSSAARRSSTLAASGRWRAKTGGHAGFQNAGLFAGDGFQAAAEVRFVIEIDGRDRRTSPDATTLVASRRPPSPTSSTTLSTACSAKTSERHGGDGFEIGGVQVDGAAPRAGVPRRRGRGRRRRRNRAAEMGWPPMRMRSVGSARCGEVNRPVRWPAARSADSIMAQVEPLPLVPATCTKRQAVLRPAQGVEHGADALQAELGGLDFVAERVEELDRIGIVHC